MLYDYLMRRLILIGGVVFILALILGLIYIRSSGNTVTSPQSVVEGSTLSGSLENRVSTLEDAVALLINRVNNLSGVPLQSSDEEQVPASPDSRVQSLEGTVANLQVQINALKGASVPTTTSGVKSPVYIPLGWSGSSQATDWTSITTQTIVIDPADYAGYTSMQFEANIQIYQGNGIAYARIYDKEDGLAAISSQVSTTSQDYNWVTSSTFQLPSSAKKTYLLQLKSSSSYAANIQNARIKVNF